MFTFLQVCYILIKFIWKRSGGPTRGKVGLTLGAIKIKREGDLGIMKWSVLHSSDATGLLGGLGKRPHFPHLYIETPESFKPPSDSAAEFPFTTPVSPQRDNPSSPYVSLFISIQSYLSNPGQKGKARRSLGSTSVNPSALLWRCAGGV